jgi:hypothetical protein
MQLGMGEPGVYVGHLDGGEAKRILPATEIVVTPHQTHVNGPLRATYAGGCLFYLDGSHGALTAQPFDVARMELTGEAVRIADKVESFLPGQSAYDVSATGMLVYRPVAAVGTASQHTWADRAQAPIIVLTNWSSLASTCAGQGPKAVMSPVSSILRIH